MSTVTSRVCKGCGAKTKLPGPAPPGAIPEGWATIGGAAYCTACVAVAGAPTVGVAQRMSDAATSAVTEACVSDPGLRAEMEHIRVTHRPGSPEFVRLVRAAVESVCRSGSESMPAAIRSLFVDVLACVSWVRVAERIAKAGTSAPSAPVPEKSGSDPFSL